PGRGRGRPPCPPRPGPPRPRPAAARPPADGDSALAPLSPPLTDGTQRIRPATARRLETRLRATGTPRRPSEAPSAAHSPWPKTTPTRPARTRRLPARNPAGGHDQTP